MFKNTETDLKCHFEGLWNETQLFFLPFNLASEKLLITERYLVLVLTYLETKEPSLKFQVEKALESAVMLLYQTKYDKTSLVEFIYGKIKGYYYLKRKGSECQAM